MDFNKNMNIITLEESTIDRVPQLLEDIVNNIIPHNKASDSLQKDYMLVLIIVLMVENKFIPINDDSNVIEPNTINVEQISKWRNQIGVYEITFVDSRFSDIVTLIMSPLGAMVLVNVVVKDLDSEAYSVCLPVSRFVVSPQSTKVPMIFRDLKQFTTTFKNKILTPVNSLILSHHGFASPSLTGLPEEVLNKIMLSLHVRDVVNVSKTCSSLKVALQSDNLWHDLAKRDFGAICPSGDKGWQSLYKEAYLAQLEQDNSSRRHRDTSGTMHDFMDYSDYVSYIDNPMWNVFL